MSGWAIVRLRSSLLRGRNRAFLHALLLPPLLSCPPLFSLLLGGSCGVWKARQKMCIRYTWFGDPLGQSWSILGAISGGLGFSWGPLGSSFALPCTLHRPRRKVRQTPSTRPKLNLTQLKHLILARGFSEKMTKRDLPQRSSMALGRPMGT